MGMLAGEVQIPSVLPFLLLGPLHRSGYLSTLEATFELGNHAERLPSAAAALANKVLEVPRKGWLYSASAKRVSTLFAGGDPNGSAPSTKALLALERFNDLDGRVRFDKENVTVRLPLGKRYFDLEKHGLLSDVPDVPWLGGRTVRFTGG